MNTDDVIHVQSSYTQSILSVDRILAKENAESGVGNTGSDKGNTELAKEENKALITDQTVESQIIDHTGKASVHDKKSTSKIGLSKKIKTGRTSKIKEIMTTPSYDFGLEGGWNAGKNSSLYRGLLVHMV